MLTVFKSEENKIKKIEKNQIVPLLKKKLISTNYCMFFLLYIIIIIEIIYLKPITNN